MAISLTAYPVRDSFSSYSHHYTKYMEQSRHSNYPSYRNRNSVASSDDSIRPSLPSISSLLGIADGPKSDKPPQRAPITLPSHQDHLERARAVQAPVVPLQFADRPRQPSYPVYEPLNVRHATIPPSSPARYDSVVDHRRSPSNVSPRSIHSQPYDVGTTFSPHSTPRSSITEHLVKRQSLPTPSTVSPSGTSHCTTSPYGTSPGSRSNVSLKSAPERPRAIPTAVVDPYHQRPLPCNFPPQPPALPPHPTTALDVPDGNLWEHHHYIRPSSAAHCRQPAERYICTTCNKTFSRPSSLKIHSHSHTGEKPFKCPRNGCQKAFSVRSNMKRHERGCHTGLLASTQGFYGPEARLR